MVVTPVQPRHNMYRTPKGRVPIGNKSHWTLDDLIDTYELKLDPCAENEQASMCDRFYTPEDNGLKQDWDVNAIFNPPFSAPVRINDRIVWKSCIGRWCDKAIHEARIHKTVVIGILPWYQSEWFFRYVWWMLRKDGIIPLGRVSYWDKKDRPMKGNRFDSFLAVWDMRR